MDKYIILFFDWGIASIVITDTVVEARKYYKANKMFVKFLWQTYPFRISALSLWLLRALYFMYFK